MTLPADLPTLSAMARQEVTSDPTTDLTKRRTVDLCRVAVGRCCMR